MKIRPWQIIAAGWPLSAVPPMLLLWQSAFSWVVCPFALCVMFARQARNAYDSLGAAGIPELMVGFAQFPVISWLLAKSFERSAGKQMVLRIVICHFVAIGAAILLAKFRNHLWWNS
jgi:hypothetical protein